MATRLHKAIEFLAFKKPELLKSRVGTKTYLVAIAKINDIKHWQSYNQLIETLLDEFCVS